MSSAKVYIIGAGPGSADLITLRGLRAIKKADYILCDSLLPKNFFENLSISHFKKQIEWLEDENGRKTQPQINELMLANTKQGKTVARVKTGDPHIFGKGMEELEFLVSHDINVEVIPGLTVATAFSSLTDMPLTQKGKANSFAAATARCGGGNINESFPRADSLIIFMGVSVLDNIIETLLKDGWSPKTPAVLLEKVSMPWQNQANGLLKNISNIAKQAEINAPAILVIGKAAEENKSLSNRPRILFTGLDPANFRNIGTILHWPAIQVVKNNREFEKLSSLVKQLFAGYFGYVIFTSRTSVKMFFKGLNNLNTDCRILSRSKVVACGAGTGEILKENGITADLVPEGMGAKAILSSIENNSKEKVLLTQSATATEALANNLALKLGSVTRLCLHKVKSHSELGKTLPQHDVIYFTCPSGVRAYWQKYKKEAFQKEVWCIGDVTQDQLDEYGIKAKVVNPYVSQNKNAANKSQ